MVLLLLKTLVEQMTRNKKYLTQRKTETIVLIVLAYSMIQE